MSEVIDFNELKASNVLPSPNGVRLKVMRLCQNEQVSLLELAKQIQTDPVMAGRMIKIANVANANRRRPVASVTTDVLILVGLQAVRQIVLGISLVTSYQDGGCKGFNYAQFWSRSVAMACAAQALTGYIRIAPTAEMFTCGLLAGIGRLGLASARPTAYSRLLQEYQDKPLADMTVAETQLFGFNHLSLAAAMMSDWSIPRLFSDSVLFHEAPQASGFAEDARQQRLVRILQMAAYIADICIAADDERESMIPALLEFGRAVGIEQEQVATVVSQTSIEWAEWGEVLQVQTRPLPPLPLLDENAAQ
jgi:HD-like signal output (HDOD) protein